MARAQQTVLLVDDESLFLTSVEDALTVRFPNLRVLRAKDGIEALEHAGNFHVHLMITDLRMSAMGGEELLAELARRSLFIPTIVTTAFGSKEKYAFSLSHGAVSFVEKPVDMDQLVSLVEQRLELPETGTIKGVSLPGFVQLFSMERQTGVVRSVHGERSGTLTFVKGALVDARLLSARGDEAALELMSWTRPTLQVEPLLGEAETTITLSLDHLLLESARLSDEAGWPEPSTAEFAAVEAVKDSWLPPALLQLGLEHESTLAQVGQPEHAIDRTGRMIMASLQETMNQLMTLDGATGCCVVDSNSGMMLGSLGGGPQFNLEIAAAGNTEVVRAKRKTMESLGLSGSIEDILITLDKQYHIIRPLRSNDALFIYLVLDKARGNLALARLRLASVESDLSI